MSAAPDNAKLIAALQYALSVLAEHPDNWASETDMFEGMRLAADEVRDALRSVGVEPVEPEGDDEEWDLCEEESPA